MKKYSCKRHKGAEIIAAFVCCWHVFPDEFNTEHYWENADGCHIEKSKKLVLMDIINSLLKTGNKTANINVKNCSL